MKNINIGIFGAGTVGKGVIKTLIDKSDLFFKRTGINIRIKSVCIKDINKKRDFPLENIILTNNPNDILEDDNIDIIVELIGGIQPCKDIIFEAIKRKKHVVTANKELISKFWIDIYSLAEENNVLVFIEGSVAGGIPIIQTLKRDLISNKIQELVGIINGTTNFILSEMTLKGKEFQETLKEAQRLGYAEADPKNDIEGHDAKYKLAILSSLISEKFILPEKIYTEGITNISKKDIEFASKFGYVIKLLAILKNHEDNKIELRVHPCMINKKHPLSSVNSSFNAIWLKGDLVGDFMLYGKGAGELPTSSSVVSDILNLCMEIKQGNYIHINIKENHENILEIENIYSKYYIRLLVEDKRGVIAIIGSIFDKADISINSLFQEDVYDNKAEIIIITHIVQEKNINNALLLMKNYKEILEVENIIRLEDF
ncbi:MAG: homoserine dehydrogenase [Candidatus Sericytochromatia bacterium]|nr:MAG: homoserine dehydrogenase [Candidatus Sericytochromatia bacterium]